jgi:PAS domain S-box-containing protein
MITLLYVDDEKNLLEIGKIFLEEFGDFSVTTLGSAQEGLKALITGDFDVIISDYQMPEMDGIGFLKEVRERFGTIPFLLFTGRGREEVVIDAINNGADFYVQKGGDITSQFAELAHKIRQAVTRRKAQDELRAAYEQIAAAEEELRSQYDELVISERLARENEKMFRELFDVVPLSSVVTDKDGRYILVNRTFEEITGYSSPEVMGKTSIELGFNSQDSEQKFLESLGATGRIDSKESIVKMRNGDERTILVSSRSVTINAAPHVITAVFDITERKQAENALRESEERFRAMIDQSPFPIIVFNLAGDIVHFNEAHLRLWGVTQEMAMRFNVFKDPQLETLGLLPAFRRAFAGERLTIPPLEYDLPAAIGEGQKKKVRGDFYPIRDAEGTVTHVILVHNDYTLPEQTPTTKSRVKDVE